MINIHTKDDTKNCSNYRTKSSISHASKELLDEVRKILKPLVEEIIPELVSAQLPASSSLWRMTHFGKFLFRTSAYCGGLWLAALRCMVEIATILELDENIDRYKTMLSRGKEAYERKLWNGMHAIYASHLHHRHFDHCSSIE